MARYDEHGCALPTNLLEAAAWHFAVVAMRISRWAAKACLPYTRKASLALPVSAGRIRRAIAPHMATAVLGSVVSSGIKVMVLGVVIGIGTNFFGEFTQSLQGSEPDIVKALSLTLAALTLFGLGIFAPGIATGLVSGAPQLGAGAALGTTLGAAGVVALGGGAAMGAAKAAGGAALGAVRAGTSMGSAAGTAYKLGQETAAAPTVGAGLGGVAQAAGNAMKQRASAALGLGEAADSGRKAAWHALTETSPKPQPAGGGNGGNGEQPAWASAMQHQQNARHHRHTAVQALREGDRGGAAATPNIDEKED